MGSISFWHWLVMILVLVVPTLLFARILPKAGISPWWAVLGLIPVLNIIGLWLFAFAPWPRRPNQQ
jgi:hypothetical protein